MSRHSIDTEPQLNPPESAARDDLPATGDDRDYERWKDELVFKELYGDHP